MAKRVHVAGIFVSCMSSVPRAFVRTPNSHAALTIHAKLFTFTCKSERYCISPDCDDYIFSPTLYSRHTAFALLLVAVFI